MLYMRSTALKTHGTSPGTDVAPDVEREPTPNYLSCPTARLSFYLSFQSE